MISLSDSELAAVMEAARPIPPRDRDQFQREVAVVLAKHEVVGVCLVSRIAAELQRRYLAAASISFICSLLLFSFVLHFAFQVLAADPSHVIITSFELNVAPLLTPLC
jgi:hypothetical protein